MTSEVFKLKGLSEQVRNDYVRGAEEKLEARLAQEAEERARKEAEERVVAEVAAKEEAKRDAVVEAEAKEKVDAEKVARIAAEKVVNTSEGQNWGLTQLSEEFRLSDYPSEVRTHWNIFLRWMTFEVFKLKGLSEQVRNDYVRGAEEKLEARLAQEAEERARKEAEERVAAEVAAKEEAKRDAVVEAEAKEKVDAEEVARIAAEKVVNTSEGQNWGLTQLSEEFRLSDYPSEVRTHWNIFLRWMTSEVFKLKGLSEQVRNDYVRGAEEKLEVRLAQEAEERARKEAEERVAAEVAAKEEAKRDAVVEAEAKEKVDAEEVARIAAEKVVNTSEVALTRGESSTSNISPLFSRL
ncbi:eukaryotic translation initiation factor 4 gamma-like [Lathyrus oleraceus]|uniref:eukaryotic translation initiation factor 4 gamma-like n=1 Tax=Pisum sativum TaxID=3888 RepID=UPI0021D100C1|nr:eukaryotic translation initiation factor 4 gamma-like [Pisum sativum]